jgi:FMN reductase
MTTTIQPAARTGGDAAVQPHQKDLPEPGHRQARSIVVISAGMSDTSSTRILADRIAQKTLDRLHGEAIPTIVTVIELRPLATSIANAIVSGFPDAGLKAATERFADADAVIAAAPVYKAGISGLFKAFIDILDNDLLIAKPVVLAATAGSARHALVVDEQLRPLFAFMRALTAPTAIFAAPEDWADTALNRRIERAATELAAMLTSGISAAITGQAWDRYQHSSEPHARPDGTARDIDFDTDLMKLATGGVFTMSS